MTLCLDPTPSRGMRAVVSSSCAKAQEPGAGSHAFAWDEGNRRARDEGNRSAWDERNRRA